MLGVLMLGLVLAIVMELDVVVVVAPSELVTSQVKVPLTVVVLGVKTMLEPVPIAEPSIVQT